MLRETATDLRFKYQVPHDRKDTSKTKWSAHCNNHYQHNATTVQLCEQISDDAYYH